VFDSCWSRKLPFRRHCAWICLIPYPTCYPMYTASPLPEDRSWRAAKNWPPSSAKVSLPITPFAAWLVTGHFIVLTFATGKEGSLPFFKAIRCLVACKRFNAHAASSTYSNLAEPPKKLYPYMGT